MELEDITVRYGGRVALTAQIDAEDAVNAVLYVGLPGQLPEITFTAPFAEGDVVNGVQMYEADLSLINSETEIPLNTYKYQINVTYPSGDPDKYPDPSCDTEDLPSFTIVEALDQTEVTS